MKGLNENRDNVLRYMVLSVLGPHLDKYIAVSKKKLEEPETGKQAVSSPKPTVVAAQVSVTDKLELPPSTSASALENHELSSAATAAVMSLPSEDTWQATLDEAKKIKAGNSKLNEENLLQLLNPDLSTEEAKRLRKTLKVTFEQVGVLRLAQQIQAQLDARKAQQEHAAKAPGEVVMEAGDFVTTHGAGERSESKPPATAVMETEASNEEESIFSSPRTLLFAAYKASASLAQSATTAAYEYVSGAKLTREKLVEMERFKLICAYLVSEPNMSQFGIEGVAADLIEQIDGKQGKRDIPGIFDKRGIQDALTAARSRNSKHDFGYSEELLQVYVCALKWLSEPEVAKALGIVKAYDKVLGVTALDKRALVDRELLNKQLVSDLFRMAFEVRLDGYLSTHKKLGHVREIDDTTRPLLVELLLKSITSFSEIDACKISDETKQEYVLGIIARVREFTKASAGAGLLHDIDVVMTEHDRNIKDIGNAVSAGTKLRYIAE